VSRLGISFVGAFVVLDRRLKIKQAFFTVSHRNNIQLMSFVDVSLSFCIFVGNSEPPPSSMEAKLTIAKNFRNRHPLLCSFSRVRMCASQI
jgi:hypothetical protein